MLFVLQQVPVSPSTPSYAVALSGFGGALASFIAAQTHPWSAGPSVGRSADQSRPRPGSAISRRKNVRSQIWATQTARITRLRNKSVPGTRRRDLVRAGERLCARRGRTGACVRPADGARRGFPRRISVALAMIMAALYT